jgi:hypothetical protein
MNSFSVFKLIIPTLKNKLIQPLTDNSSPLTFAATFHALNEWQPAEHLLAAPKITAISDPPFRIALDEPEEKPQDEEDTCKSTCSFPHSDHQLVKNMMENRVKSVQYEANNPCEDTLACDQLKMIGAYAISVFDGHGGP